MGRRLVRWCWVKLPVPGVLLHVIWIIIGHGPTALALGAGGGLFDYFFLSSIISLFLPLSGRRYDIEVLSQRPAKPKTTNQNHKICNSMKQDHL